MSWSWTVLLLLLWFTGHTLESEFLLIVISEMRPHVHRPTRKSFAAVLGPQSQAQFCLL